MEQRCACPSALERNVIRPFAAQWRFVPPCVDGADFGGAFHNSFVWPVFASPLQIAHFLSRRTRRESGAPPLPGERTNAIRAPSGDQRGDASRDGDGASQRIEVESFV